VNYANTGISSISISLSIFGDLDFGVGTPLPGLIKVIKA
jgi:hypothetical protein